MKSGTQELQHCSKEHACAGCSYVDSVICAYLQTRFVSRPAELALQLQNADSQFQGAQRNLVGQEQVALNTLNELQSQPVMLTTKF